MLGYWDEKEDSWTFFEYDITSEEREARDTYYEIIETHMDSLVQRSIRGMTSTTELSDTTGEPLSKNKAYILNGYEITELSDTAAESLSEHEGDLILPSLKELSDAAAESLSKHKGVFFALASRNYRIPQLSLYQSIKEILLLIV